MACQFFLDLVARFAVTIAMNTGTAAKNVDWTPMPDPIREEEVNIQLTWSADARTELAIRRQASLIGFKNPADYITQMIARSLECAKLHRTDVALEKVNNPFRGSRHRKSWTSSKGSSGKAVLAVFI
jgi:hypothetical protein